MAYPIVRQFAFAFIAVGVSQIATAQVAYSNASLNGTYRLVTYSFDFVQNGLGNGLGGMDSSGSCVPNSSTTTGICLLPVQGAASSMVSMTFDGIGTFTITGSKIKVETITSSPYLVGPVLSPGSGSGNYSVSASGVISSTIIGAINGDSSGQIVGDGTTFLMFQNVDKGLPLIGVGVKDAGATSNTAQGLEAFAANTTGTNNTALGLYALNANTQGYANTATGSRALALNTIGWENTANGYAALNLNTLGAQNTAIGANALVSNGIGNSNSAVGYAALQSNTSGINNTAFGVSALGSNTTGYGNAAQGYSALGANTTGIRNTAVGNGALIASTGSYNIALGWSSGYNLASGNNNIEIGNLGAINENGTIRIGSAGTHMATYIAGITGTQITGSAVYITASGQLGVLASSERYKTDVANMEPSARRLDQLRPVTFKLKSDPTGTVQYGLIAEEVARVYPELVIRNADGKIDGVRYEELTPLLLNVVQQQQRELEEMHRQIAQIIVLQQVRRAPDKQTSSLAQGAAQH